MALTVAFSTNRWSFASAATMRSRRSTASRGRVEVFDPLREAVLRRVLLITVLPLARSRDVDGGDLLFLGQHVCDDGDVASVKEIEQAVLNGSLFGAKLVDSILKIVRCGATQLMPEHP